MTVPWDWKPRDGKRGGLLYQSGNWGDWLKMLWLAEVMAWKSARDGRDGVAYFDPFAGAVRYPLDWKTRFRLNQAALAGLDFIKEQFTERGFWPSSAAAAGLLTAGERTVFDADASRRGEWLEIDGVGVAEGDSGWSILAAREVDERALWLVDPYDFLAGWRDVLPVLAEKAKTATVLLYVYNRAAKSDEAFRDYKAFRNALADLRRDAPFRLGRAAADAFLPRAHHEVVLLPGSRDLEREDFGALSAALEARTAELAGAIARAGVFDA